MSEWKQNLPHIIALLILLFALLLVLTRVGLVGCSTFGAGYCDLYYGIFGRPRILVVYDSHGPGIGDPVALSRYLTDQKRLLVTRLDVNQISSGMLKRYDVVIVEHARDIPTDKLKLFYDYVINGMGRLVWVGDSGTIIGDRDTFCRELDYTVKWRTSQGTKEVSKSEDVCIKSSDISLPSNFSSAQFALAARDELYQKAWQKLGEMCKDAFGGELSRVKMLDGYQCQETSKEYLAVYFNWENEGDFKELVNPWNRGKFKFIGQQESQSGFKFGRDILGVTFVSDAYAVSAYSEFSGEISKVRDEFSNAHSALLSCTGSSCDPSRLEAQLENASNALSDEVNKVSLDLKSDISELESIKQQKELKNQTDEALELSNVISSLKSGESTLPDNLGWLDTVKSQIMNITEIENDSVVRNQLTDIANHMDDYKSRIQGKLLAVDDLKDELSSCQNKGLLDKWANETGIPKDVLASLTSISNQPSDEDLLAFIGKVKSGYYDRYVHLLETSSCKAGAYFADAILSAKNISNPAKKNKALAVMRVEDAEHPLALGISQSIDLVDKLGNPVPFVLVATGNEYTHVVASLKVTPAYKGEDIWPAITVRDPKYGSHIFGRGVVVYYAFPPETSPVLLDNLVKFILY